MSEREFENTVQLFDNISDDDIQRLIVHLQYIRQKRRRKFESTVTHNFCDECQRTYPGIVDECPKCDKPTRRLPIYVNFAYLIDGPEQAAINPYFTTIR